MAMAVAIDNSCLALDFIPEMQRELDHAAGNGRRFHIHRVSAHATILPHDPEIWRQSLSALNRTINFDDSVVKQEALDWQADPDDDLGDAAVLNHLHQQAATVPLLSSVIFQSDLGNAATTLTGSALSASINARTQGRLLSSFHRHSFRRSCLALGNSISDNLGLGRTTNMTELFPSSVQDPMIFDLFYSTVDLSRFIVWAGTQRLDHLVLWQVQVDVVDLCCRRTQPTHRARKRRRTAFDTFLQVSDSPVVEDTSRGNPLPDSKGFNGVRYRPDRKIWVAEMKPPKHRTKQDFGNFKSAVEAARAVDVAFHHYGRPDLLNFPDTSLQFLSTRPTAAPGLDEKVKVKFVKQEAKALLAAIAASSPLHSTHTNSIQVLDLPASPRSSPSDHLRSFPEISLPFSCSDPSGVDDVVSQPMLLDSMCDICTTGTVLETIESVQDGEQGWDWSEDSSTPTAPPNIVNSNACEIQSMWLNCLIRSPPAPTYSRSSSPSHLQGEIAYALLE